MSQFMSEIYVKLKEELIEFLKKNDFCSITTDGWSSKKKKKAFISLTIHYLNLKFVLESISLGIITVCISFVEHFRLR